MSIEAFYAMTNELELHIARMRHAQSGWRQIKDSAGDLIHVAKCIEAMAENELRFPRTKDDK